MRKFICALLSFACSYTYAQQTRITIDAGKPGADISKNLYGIFFEEINHAGEAGIYGELIRNRGFEENRIPEDMTRNGENLFTKNGWIHRYPQPDSLAGWKLVKTGDAKGFAKQVSINPLNEQNPMSAQLDITSLGNGSIGLSNNGFWGIALKANDNYKLSFYARSSASFKGAVNISLVDDKGNVLAQKEIQGIGKDWKKFECTLKSSATNTNASLVIKGLSKGTLWLDMVSMFPEKTFKNRPIGLRNDLAEMVGAVKPGFLRFPGGCIVEGATLANRVRWKNTIGDIAKRPGHWVLWDYHSTDGLGYHEFLQYCEDINTPAMYVVSVGMSCQFRKSEHVDAKELQPYIDEVMDALEYALGPVTSKWGAERAKNGHPQPFNLKYVEIGNENYGPVYQEHYNYFFRAIKAKYPQINTITCTDPGMRDAFKRTDLPLITEPVEMIDEHFYESPDFFYKNATRFDNYDRKGPKIYVGEYAVKKWENTLKGDLEAALAEAAFKTGFERNADIVRLSSLAPTFVHESDRTWNPDLITYDNHRAFGGPSYQVEKLFSNNIPDKVLPIVVENSGEKINNIRKGVGMIGLTNPVANCHYKDVNVVLDGKNYADKALLNQDIINKQDADGYSVKAGEFLDLRFNAEFLKLANESGWKDFTVNMKARADQFFDNDAFTVLFYSNGPKSFLKWNIGQWARYNWLQWYDSGYESYFGQQPGGVEPNRWYDVSIRVKNDSVFCSLDGKLIHSVLMPQLITPGVYASSGINADGQIVIKVVNPTNDAKNIPVSISNSAKKYTKVHAEVITGELHDTNSFEQPLKVAPVGSDSEITGNDFNYQFAPRSITVLRLTPSK